MKRYLVFAGVTYYASGGFDDFVGDYVALSDALNSAAALARPEGTWAHVYDGEARRIVYRNGMPYQSDKG